MSAKSELHEKLGVDFDFVLGRMEFVAKTPEDLLRGLIGFAEGIGDGGYAYVLKQTLARAAAAPRAANGEKR